MANFARNLGSDKSGFLITDIINNFDISKSDILINPIKDKFQIDDNNVCTATLTFFLVDIINKKINSKFGLNDYFVFCLISTICDVMPLKGFNRKILTFGFRNLIIKNKGLKRLVSNNIKKKLSYLDIGFKIGISFSPFENCLSILESVKDQVTVSKYPFEARDL